MEASRNESGPMQGPVKVTCGRREGFAALNILTEPSSEIVQLNVRPARVKNSSDHYDKNIGRNVVKFTLTAIKLIANKTI
jgi:hypothetical protein